MFILGWIDDKGHPLEVVEELARLIPTARTTVARTPEAVAEWPNMIGEFIRRNA